MYKKKDPGNHENGSLVAPGFLINNQIPGRNQMGGREEQRRTRDKRTVSAFQGRMPDVGIGCRNFAKGAMRHFGIIANRAFVVYAGKLFWESSRKNFWGNSTGKNLGNVIGGFEILEVKFYVVYMTESQSLRAGGEGANRVPRGGVQLGDRQENVVG